MAAILFHERKFIELAQKHGVKWEHVSKIGNAFQIHAVQQRRRSPSVLLKAVEQLLPFLQDFTGEEIGNAIFHATRNNHTYTGIVREVAHNLSNGLEFLEKERIVKAGAFSIVPALHRHPSEAVWGYEVQNALGQVIATIGFNFTLQGRRIENLQGVKGKKEELTHFSKVFDGRPWEHVIGALVVHNASTRGERVYGIRGDKHHLRFIEGTAAQFERYTRTWSSLRFRKTRGRYFIATQQTRQKSQDILKTGLDEENFKKISPTRPSRGVKN